jgi:uncharacterized protein YbjT (DUF2867 family)
MPKTALIAGGTGLVGSHCLQLLLASPEYASVTALVRRSTEIKHAKLREQIVDFEKLTNLPAVDDVYCALGTTIKKAGSQPAFRRVDFEFPLHLGERSLAAGAKQLLLVSSVGANSKSGNFYLRTKGELEDALRQLPLTALHLFRPSFLVGERKEQRTGERLGIMVAEALNFTMVGGLRKYRSIAAEVVAKAMVKARAHGSIGVHIYEYDEIERLAGE